MSDTQSNQFFLGYDADTICKLRHGLLQNIRAKDASGWLYPKNSILKRLFDKQLLNLTEKGIIRQLYLKYFVGLEQDVCEVETKPIQFHIVVTVFNILIGGCVLAILLLILELYVKNKV